MNRYLKFSAPAIIVGFLTLTSCDKKADVAGTWTGTSIRLENVEDAADADATLTFVFTNNEGSEKNNGGYVGISALIDVNQAVENSNVTIDQAYEVSVAATATISGTWTYEQGDDDDIVIALNPQSLQVIVDPHSVTFSNNILTGAQQPTVDSLSTSTVEHWKSILTKSMSQEFYQFQKISDIKIKNGIMSCEVNDRDMTFRKQ